MDFYFVIGYRQCGLKEIPISIKSILQKRLINVSTDIVAVVNDLLDGKDIIYQWCLRILVPNNHLSNQSFFYYSQFHSRCHYYRLCVDFYLRV